jgi:ABC-type polar amino acid transport system ATPase subunit
LAVIVVENLVKSHGKTKVLDGVTLTVKPGDVAVVLGPSGGGKSTLLRCINGLEPFQSGTVRVGDMTLEAGLSQHGNTARLVALRRRVGMVFQQFNLFANMNVLQNVMAGPRYALGQSAEQAEPTARQLLERVGLSDKANARVEDLSGGQQQRVAIARALAVKPEVILFDEPTSALDPRTAGEVLSVITELARSGQTMLVVTHAMGFARQVASTIHIMHAGRVEESGPPEQIFDAPTSAVTRAFLAQARQS